ncbi:MAG: glycosyltransferase family 4 protein [Gemmatimonadaceae bacterium]|jgi:glycosyltransferase involved in cell wall biosynthesis|nr:glycosyltransferase family 4 protein [Gemmatimonadaceae bacterium]
MARRPRVVLLDLSREWGPQERHVLWLAEALAKSAARPVVAAHPAGQLHHYARLRGIPVLAVDSDGGWAPFAARRLAAALRTEDAALVHAFSSRSATLAALALRGRSAPLIVSVHPDDTDAPSALASWAIRQASAVMAPTVAARQAIIDVTRADPERVGTVAPLVDLSAPPAAADEATLRELGVPADAPVAMFIGSLAPADDPISFVRAVADARRAVPGLVALLIGEGPQRDAIGVMAGPLGLQGALLMPGARADAERLLSASRVLVACGAEVLRAEAVLRAFAAGVPVVATAVAGIESLVADGDSGLLVPVGDARALASAMVTVLSDAVVRSQCIAGGRRRATEFSLERASARTVAIYRAVLGQSHAHVDPAVAHRTRAPVNPIVVGELVPTPRAAAPSRLTIEDGEIILQPSQAIG